MAIDDEERDRTIRAALRVGAALTPHHHDAEALQRIEASLTRIEGLLEVVISVLGERR